MRVTIVLILSVAVLLLATIITVAKAPAISAIEAFIANPFKADLKRQNMDEYIRGRINVQKQPIQNEFYPGQTDTIFIFNKRKSSLSLYKRGGELLFYQADVSSRRVKFRDDIHIGMQLEELHDILPGLHETEPGILSYQNTRGDELRVYTGKNKVKRIYIERYIE